MESERNEIKNDKAVTREKVINGLKFIAENQSISQEELVMGLLELGCNFSADDIAQQYPGTKSDYENASLFDGIRQGDFWSGANVIQNVRDNEGNRAFVYEWFLSEDNNSSIYHFIRIATGDKNYTKENIEALNQSHKGKPR